MRQLAYYGAVPDKQEKTRIEMIENKERIEQEVDEENNRVAPIAPSEVHFPEIHKDYEYLKELFLRSGQAMSGSTGMVALTWTELHHFRKEYKGKIHSWEMEILKDMSDAFCAEHYKAKNPRHPIPYLKEVQERSYEDELAKSESIFNFLMAFKQNREK